MNAAGCWWWNMLFNSDQICGGNSRFHAEFDTLFHFFLDKLLFPDYEFGNGAFTAVANFIIAD